MPALPSPRDATNIYLKCIHLPFNTSTECIESATSSCYTSSVPPGDNLRLRLSASLVVLDLIDVVFTENAKSF